MSKLPFTTLKCMHSNLACLTSTNSDKYDINDANRISYAVKYNREISNLVCVADENGYLKLFRTYPTLKPIKELSAEKSCIYDILWLNSYEIACGGGDKHVSIFDVNKMQRTALLNGHKESIKSIAHLPINPHVIASGSRDGSVLIYDVRCNRSESIDLPAPTAAAEGEDPAEHRMSTIRPVNSIQKAHCVDDHPSSSLSSPHQNRILKASRSSAANHILSSPSASSSSSSANKRATPVSCVVFQSEHLLMSGGATDGLVKAWDTRKLYTTSSFKKHSDPVAMYAFDGHIDTSSSSSSSSRCGGSQVVRNTKGFSSLLFNSTRSLLYANCMNNFIYEYNMVSASVKHTRLINQLALVHPGGGGGSGATKAKSTFNSNQSNFIKSCLSSDDAFLLTGSSDFNAYIYSTNINSALTCFKRAMPVIVLKAHKNEVTAVDWNPMDANQVITCSDDNTIRTWNVKREMDLVASKEINFAMAECLNEFQLPSALDETTTSDTNTNTNEQQMDNTSATTRPHQITAPPSRDNDYDDDDSHLYTSEMRFNRRLYNKNMPHMTGVYDDYLFTRYDLARFAYKSTQQQQTSDAIIEAELCAKYQHIQIDTSMQPTNATTTTNSVDCAHTISPVSRMLTSIEEELRQLPPEQRVAPLKEHKQIWSRELLCRPLANLPINLRDDQVSSSSSQSEATVTSKAAASSSSSSECAKQAEAVAAPPLPPPANNPLLNLNSFVLRRQHSSSTMLSAAASSTSSSMDKKVPTSPTSGKPRGKSILRRQGRLKGSIHDSPKRLLPLAVANSSAAKKRNLNEMIGSASQGNNNNNDDEMACDNSQPSAAAQHSHLVDGEPRTPQSKRRLIMHPNQRETTTAPSSPCHGTPNGKQISDNAASTGASPLRTILHYFSPKPAK